MIGLDYIFKLKQLLAEFSSSWMNLKTSYDYIYKAARDFAKETMSLQSSQTINLVSMQSQYTLMPDYLEIIMKDQNGSPMISYLGPGSQSSYPVWLTYEDYSDYLQSQPYNPPDVPNNFTIGGTYVSDILNGTAQLSTTAVGGESVLTSTGADFSSLFSGDSVINTTRNYLGIILNTLPDSSSVNTAMFDMNIQTGQPQGWTVGDSYIIRPSPRYQILLDPAPLQTPSNVIISYIALPLPVYSDYGVYGFATGYEDALISYAAWLYKYRESRPNFGDPLFLMYERDMRKAKNVHRKASGLVSGGLNVNFMKRPYS
jgi:hypothetical protein